MILSPWGTHMSKDIIDEALDSIEARPILKLKWTTGPAYYTLSISVGCSSHPEMATCGELCLYPLAADMFRYTLRQGIQKPGFEGILEEGWPGEKKE